MVTTYIVRRIQDVVEVSTTLTQSWFRGHSRIHGELTPKVFRPLYTHELYTRFRDNPEFSIIESFKRQAPALATPTPAPGDALGWLFLMQHHGVPTRLLDWTENPLVALYFCVNADPKEHGELWAMYPLALNKHTGFWGLPVVDNPTLQFLARESSALDPEVLAADVNRAGIPEYPLAFTPTHAFARVVTQMSVFTIHPQPTEGKTIQDLLTDPKHLVRYVVPASAKARLKRELYGLGVRPQTLFPDLDHLAEGIKAEHEVVAYTPPEPPRWQQEPLREEDLASPATLEQPAGKSRSKSIATLSRLARNLIRLTTVITTDQQYDDDDHMAFMGLSFVCKQIEHLGSMLQLAGRRDIALIARSMLEGWWQILYASKSPEERAQKWRLFVHVHDWRTMRMQETLGISILEEDRHRIEANLSIHGDNYLRPSACNAKARGKPMPEDPYCDNWTCTSIWAVATDEERDGELQYQLLYKPFCDWHHWSPGGLGSALTRTDTAVDYCAPNNRDTEKALATGFLCLFQTADVVQRHLQREMDQQLEGVLSAFKAWGRTVDLEGC